MEDFVEVQKLIAKRARRHREEKSQSRQFVEHMILKGYISADGKEKTEFQVQRQDPLQDAAPDRG